MCLTLFGPAYFGVSGIPLNIFGLCGIRVPILVGNGLPRHDLPHSEVFMKFGCHKPSKKMFDFWNFCSSNRCLTQFVRVWNFGFSDFFLLQQNVITLQWKKCTAPFQIHNREKSSFFNALVCVVAQIYVNTWQGVNGSPSKSTYRIFFC